MSNRLLVVWFIGDLIWTALLFGGCAYLVFWRGYSGWWFALAIVLGPALGGENLYKSLREQTRSTPHQVEEKKS